MGKDALLRSRSAIFARAPARWLDPVRRRRPGRS